MVKYFPLMESGLFGKTSTEWIDHLRKEGLT